MKRSANIGFLYVSIILFIFALSANAAKYELTASVDRNICNVGERISYIVSISGKSSLPDIKPPNFTGFKLVSGPNTSTSLEMVNGRVSRESTSEYILRASKPGNFVIKPATAKKSRKVYKSESVTVEVLPTGQSPISRNKSNVNDAVKNRRSLPDVFLVADVDKKEVYLRDLVTVTYELYFKVNVSNYAFPNLPRSTGFWQEEFKTPARPVIRDTNVKGIPYKVATIRKVGLFPTRTGALEVGSLTADISVEVAQKSRRRSIWDDPFFSRNRTEVKSVTTQPVKLNVLGLPFQGKPSNFKGDVGDYKLRVSYDKRQVTQHDAINVTVTINGKGYIKSVQPPELVLPDGFEQFDPTVTDNISSSAGSMRGKKTFKYLVIPRRSGTFRLDPVQFSFFNPKTKKYNTVKSGAVTLSVKEAEEDQYLAGGGFIPEEIALLGSDIRFVKELNSPLIKVKQAAFKSSVFLITLLLSPLLFLLGLGAENIIEKRMADPVKVRMRKAPEFMRKNLIQANKMMELSKTHEAISLADQALREYIGAIVQEPAAGLTGNLIDKGFKEKEIEEELITEIKGLLNESDHIKFSGVNIETNGAQIILDRVKSVGSKLEKIN